jgi:uncharacterized protein YcfL
MKKLFALSLSIVFLLSGCSSAPLAAEKTKEAALIDNEGFVIGVTTWGHKVEQYNGAVSLDAFCVKILDCQYDFEGEKTWWDYSN